MTRVLVLDAQGGGMGRAVVEQLKKAMPDQPVRELSTSDVSDLLPEQLLFTELP